MGVGQKLTVFLQVKQSHTPNKNIGAARRHSVRRLNHISAALDTPQTTFQYFDFLTQTLTLGMRCGLKARNLPCTDLVVRILLTCT